VSGYAAIAKPTRLRGLPGCGLQSWTPCSAATMRASSRPTCAVHEFVSYLRYYGRAGRTAAIAVVDPKKTSAAVSFALDIGRPDDRPPSIDLGLLQSREPFR
jgi:hypothetical protein